MFNGIFLNIVQDTFPLQRLHSSYDFLNYYIKETTLLSIETPLKLNMFFIKNEWIENPRFHNANPNLASTDWLSDIDSDIHPHTTKHKNIRQGFT